MAITGIGSGYNSYMYENTYAARKNEAANNAQGKTETKGTTQTKAENTQNTESRSTADYYSYLSKTFDCVKNGNVAIAGSYIKQCANNPQKAKELEENLAFYKESYKSGYESAKANAKAQGARLVNYSESWSIDSSGNVTMQTSVTITSDTKGWKELKEEQEERLKEKKEKEKQEEKAQERKAKEQEYIEDLHNKKPEDARSLKLDIGI